MKPVGEYTVEKGNFSIEYTVEDQSFDHAFGRHRQFGWIVDKVELHCEELDKWLDVTSLIERNNWLSKHVDSIVESDFEVD